MDRARKKSPETFSGAQNIAEKQNQTFRAATEALTEEQKQQILHHQEKVWINYKDSVSSREEGTSNNKGKAIDPWEWENVDLSQENLDIGVQTAVLYSFNPHNASPECSRKKSSHRKEKLRELFQEHEPVAVRDAPRPPMFPPIFLRHLCIFLLIVASPRRSALAAPIPESDHHVT